MVRVIQGQLDQGRGRRIAVIAYTEYPSDARVRWEAETLVGAGHKVFAIGLRPKSGPSPAELSGVQVYDVPLRACRGSKMRYVYQYAIFFLLSSVLLLRLHLRERFDVIYVHSLPDFQVFCALPLKIARIPVLLDLHEAMPEIFAARFQKSRESSWFRVFAALERMSCFFADHVISANDGIRSLLVTRRVPASHITTLYNVYEPVPRSVS